MSLRHLSRWFLVQKKNSNQPINKLPRLSLPPSTFKANTVLGGWLVPVNPQKHKEVYVEIADLKSYVMDSNRDFRGYWVCTETSYYWLCDPDEEGHPNSQFDKFFVHRMILDVTFAMVQKAHEIGAEKFVKKDVHEILPLVRSPLSSDVVRTELRILRDIPNHVLVGYLRDFVVPDVRTIGFDLNECNLVMSLRDLAKGKAQRVGKPDKDEWLLAVEEQLKQLPWGGPADKASKQTSCDSLRLSAEKSSCECKEDMRVDQSETAIKPEKLPNADPEVLGNKNPSVIVEAVSSSGFSETSTDRKQASAVGQQSGLHKVTEIRQKAAARQWERFGVEDKCDRNVRIVLVILVTLDYSPSFFLSSRLSGNLYSLTQYLIPRSPRKTSSLIHSSSM